MPFEERQSRKFIKIAEGSICMDENPQDAEGVRELRAKGYEPVTTDKGKSFLRKKFKSLTAIITSISHQEKEWEGKTIKSWNINVVDGEDLYTLSISENSNNAITLLSALFNADVSQPVKIRPYSIKNGDSVNTGVTLYQNDQKLENYFFKSIEQNGKWVRKYANGFPEMPNEQLEEEEYNYHKAKQVKFLRNAVLTDLALRFDGRSPNQTADKFDDDFDKALPATVSANKQVDDDLPF